MIIPKKISILLFSFFHTYNISSQTLKGQIYDLKDSIPVSFATIIIRDFTDKNLVVQSANLEGQFNIQLPKQPYYLIIAGSGYALLKIINITKEYSDTLDLGQLPLIAIPLVQVSFRGISERKERRFQRKLVKDYNRNLMARKNQLVEIKNKQVYMTVEKIRETDSERMTILYVIDMNEIVEKN